MGQRFHFCAKFQKYGLKPGTVQPTETIILTDITRVDTGECVAEHVWVTETKRFRALGQLNEGDFLEFFATVTQYEGGYRGRDIVKLLACPPRVDYWLYKITEVRRVKIVEKT